MDQPVYVTMRPVFNKKVLRPSLPVRVEGIDDEGDRIDGYYLVRHCEYETLRLTDAYGSSLEIHISAVLREKDKTMITLLES